MAPKSMKLEVNPSDKNIHRNKYWYLLKSIGNTYIKDKDIVNEIFLVTIGSSSGDKLCHDCASYFLHLQRQSYSLIVESTPENGYHQQLVCFSSRIENNWKDKKHSNRNYKYFILKIHGFLGQPLCFSTQLGTGNCVWKQRLFDEKAKHEEVEVASPLSVAVCPNA